MNLRKKTVLVLGMGETGLSMVNWLLRLGANVRVADSRLTPPNLDELRKLVPPEHLFIGAFSVDIVMNVDLISISPGVPLAEPVVRQAVKCGIQLVSDIELFALALKESNNPRPKILAITGSNGKTTVTAMVGAMAKKAGWDTEIAGNIGPAVMNAFMRRESSRKFPQLWVLEISSFQLETTQSLNPDAAVVLNLSEDHFDRYVGMQDYALAKARIFLGDLDNDTVQILNRDDSLVSPMALTNKRQITFGLGAPPSEKDFGLLRDGADIWLVQGEARLIKASELVITGLHNISNSLAALALCHSIGLPFEPLLESLREFQGLPHRMQKITSLNDITFYDDSKGTNVGATVAALQGMTQSVILIAGGDGKKQNFSPLKKVISEHVRAVVLIGRDAGEIAAAIDGCGASLHSAITMEEAVQKSFLLAQTGDAVVMSPACASFDMFRDYIHRAEVFILAINNLQPKNLTVETTMH